jgi:hypothetical protein
MVTRFLWPLLILCVALANGHAQTGACAGPMLDHYRDGDSNPLIWEFDTYLAKPSSASEPAWISYFKNVSNESTAEVRRVYWPVAHYYRRYLNPSSASPSCITMAGPTKPILSIGPLYHGIAEHYDTNVREPLEGWKETDTGGIKPVFVQASAGRPLPPIESYFVVNTADTSPPQTATIKITSSAFETDNLLLQKSVLNYEFVSTGNAPVRLFVNLPQDEALAKAAIKLEKRLLRSKALGFMA